MIDRVKITEIADQIVSGYNPDKMILFGSFAPGYPNEYSDVDLIVIEDTGLPWP